MKSPGTVLTFLLANYFALRARFGFRLYSDHAALRRRAFISVSVSALLLLVRLRFLIGVVDDRLMTRA